MVVGDEPDLGFLIQAKALTSGKVTNSAVQEVVTALKPYGDRFRVRFVPVVATNQTLTRGARELLNEHSGQVFERAELAAALREYDIVRSEIELLDRTRFKWEG